MARIAIAQIQSSIDKHHNLHRALGLIDQAKQRQADLIAFPEFFMAFSPANQTAAELSALAESVHGPFITALAAAARFDSSTTMLGVVFQF